jgi:tripartite-type tricarboxylate transporter receptor subunit TctC
MTMLNHTKRLGTAALIGCLAAIALPGASLAQSFPDHPVTLIVSSKVGGSIDAMARQLAPYWEKALGQKVNVENKTGADGITGVRYFMEQPDDGYTILICTEAHFTATVEKSDDVKPADAELINMQQFDPTSFTVLETSPFKTIEDLVKQVQEKPDTVTWGSPPTGSAAMVGKLVSKDWDLKMRYVPQASGAETDTALLGCHVDLKVGSAASDTAELQGIRILAVSSPERLAFLPDVPTFNEAGEKLGFKAKIPNLGTARLVLVRSSLKEKHPEVFEKLAESYKVAFNDPGYQEALKKSGQAFATTLMEPDVATARFRELIEESVKYRKELSGG